MGSTGTGWGGVVTLGAAPGLAAAGLVLGAVGLVTGGVCLEVGAAGLVAGCAGLVTGGVGLVLEGGVWLFSARWAEGVTAADAAAAAAPKKGEPQQQTR